jgi:hypothetical protein
MPPSIALFACAVCSTPISEATGYYNHPRGLRCVDCGDPMELKGIRTTQSRQALDLVTTSPAIDYEVR